MDESNITIGRELFWVVSKEGGEACQLMQRVRLHTSNSRARATQGNLAASWMSDKLDILLDQMVGL